MTNTSIYTRKIRETGETLTIGRPAELGVADEGRWVTLCEDHNTLVYSDTRDLAYRTRGIDFCDDCRDRQRKNPTGRKVNFKDQAQNFAYSEGLKDGMDLLVTALEEGGTINHLLEILEHNARPETVKRLNAFYGSK